MTQKTPGARAAVMEVGFSCVLMQCGRDDRHDFSQARGQRWFDPRSFVVFLR